MNRFTKISNSELTGLIDEWIKSERDRYVMRRTLIDGITYERIAEELQMSTIQIYRIVKRRASELAEICNEWQTISI